MKYNIFKNKLYSLLFALLACILWGTLYPGVKIAYRTLGIDGGHIPSTLLFAGMQFIFMGILALSGYSVSHKGYRLPKGYALKYILTVVFLGTVLGNALSYSGLSLTSSGKAAIIKQFGFFLLPSIAFLFRKEDGFSIRKMLSGVLGFASVVMINLDGMKFNITMGDVLILCAAIASAASTIISKNAYDKLEPLYTMGHTELLGGLILLMAGLLSGGKIEEFSLAGAASLLYCSVAYVTASFLWGHVLKYNNVSKLSVIKFAEPLSAVILSGIFLKENILRPTYFIALLLVFASIVLITRERGTKSEKCN